MLDAKEKSDADLIKDMKIKLKSKAYKGRIKLSWTTNVTVKGVKYQIYRSTKKNSGFGKKPFFTTKSRLENLFEYKKTEEGQKDIITKLERTK